MIPFTGLDNSVQALITPLIAGTTLLITKLQSLVNIGTTIAPISYPTLWSDIFMLSTASVNSPATSACSDVTIPKSLASCLRPSISSVVALNTCVSSAPSLSPKIWFATAVLVASSPTLASAFLIFMKAWSVSSPAISSTDKPIKLNASATFCDSPEAISPSKALVLTKAFCSCDWSTAKIWHAWAHSW